MTKNWPDRVVRGGDVKFSCCVKFSAFCHLATACPVTFPMSLSLGNSLTHSSLSVSHSLSFLCHSFSVPSFSLSQFPNSISVSLPTPKLLYFRPAPEPTTVHIELAQSCHVTPSPRDLPCHVTTYSNEFIAGKPYYRSILVNTGKARRPQVKEGI